MFLHTITYAVLIYFLIRNENREKVKTKNEIYRINTARFYFILILGMSVTISLMGIFWNGAVLGKYMPFITMIFFFIIVANSVNNSNNILKLSNKQNSVSITTVLNDAEKIRTIMENEKHYLDKNLTLDELAAKLSWSRHQISYAINNGLGITFFELINKYRVEESLKIISDPCNIGLKIDQISEMSGFNSRAAFYKAFKNYTGKTPTEYRDTKTGGV
jgi:YesN/AraC family two-component response regulator